MKSKFLASGLILLCFSLNLHAQGKVSLRDAIILARNNNPFYKTEKMNIEIAKTAVTTASLRPNPNLNFSIQQIPSVKNFAPNTGFFSSANRQVTYQVGETIPLKGQRKYKIDIANADLDISKTSLSDYERNLLNDVSQKWLEVWFANKKLELIAKAQRYSDTLLITNKIRLKDQVITTTEFTRTQIIDEQYQLMLLEAQQELNSAGKDLAIMLGINNRVEIDDTPVLFSIPISESVDSLINYALLNRTDILTSKRAEDRAKIDQMLQEANKYQPPEVGISYSTQNKVGYIGAYVNIPIPTFDRNEGEISRAKISSAQAHSLTEANCQKVKSEIQNAYNQYQTCKSAFEKHKIVYAKSENVLNNVKISYIKGGTTILDYLEAEKSWFDIQNDYFESLYNYRKSYINLLVLSNLILNIQ